MDIIFTTINSYTIYYECSEQERFFVLISLSFSLFKNSVAIADCIKAYYTIYLKYTFKSIV